MAEIDAATLAERSVLLGLVTQDQAFQAREDAADGTFEALASAFLRKGLLTSYQIERMKKNDLGGFFFGGCKVLFHLAEGTFARVYRGSKQPGNQPIAVKVLRQRFVADPTAVERFNKEAESGMRLVHPNIVRIYDYGNESQRHYILMEYIEGSNLRDFLRIRKRFEAEAAMPLMLGLARGLEFSHDSGVTHRDIKGTNILIGTSGAAKLVDFGLATLRDVDRDKRVSSAHGERTVDYAALERACGSPKGDPRSDIFFLGCVFYQMLTGQPPMSEVESKDMLTKMLKRSFGAIKPLGEHRHAPPQGVTRIIDKMMRMDVKERYQAMGEVVRDLEAYHESSLKATEVIHSPSGAVVESDDLESFSPDDIFFRPGEAAAAPAPAPEPTHVLCVEVQDEIREVFRKVLTKMGYKVLLVQDAERAAERYRESQPDAVVFDLDGLGADGIDSFLDMHEKAHEDGHDLAALVLLGPRQGELRSRFPTDDRIIVLAKPIKMKDVQDALTGLVPIADQGRRS